jgi:uncharacterized protein
VLKRIFLAPIRFYRRYLSPLKGAPTCRYLPSCSEYALESIEKRGVLVGSFAALWRILRCNPLFAGGYDPVRPGPGSPGHLAAGEEGGEAALAEARPAISVLPMTGEGRTR